MTDTTTPASFGEPVFPYTDASAGACWRTAWSLKTSQKLKPDAAFGHGAGGSGSAGGGGGFGGSGANEGSNAIMQPSWHCVWSHEPQPW